MVRYDRVQYREKERKKYNPPLHQSILSAFVLEIIGRRKISFINLLPQAIGFVAQCYLLDFLYTSIHHEVTGLMKGTPSLYPPLNPWVRSGCHILYSVFYPVNSAFIGTPSYNEVKVQFTIT